MINNGYKICKLEYKWKLYVTIRGRPTAIKSVVFLWLYGNDELLYEAFLWDTLYMKRDLKQFCE